MNDTPRPCPQPIPFAAGVIAPSEDGSHVVDAASGRPILTKKPGPVTLSDREGVFAHSFKCWVCDLEFVLFSWLRDRHGVGRVACPECTVVTPMLHWLTVLSQSPTFATAGEGTEIYAMVPVGEADLLDDSTPPPDERFE